MAHLHFSLIFPALMTFAASYDWLVMKISNRLCLIVAASFFPAAVIAGLDAGQIALHMSCAAAMLALGLGLYAMGWIGGGDAKLFAAAALWFGWGKIAGFGVAVAIAGGLLALAVIALRLMAVSLPPIAAVWLAPRSELPYGIALAAATLVIYPTSFWTTGGLS